MIKINTTVSNSIIVLKNQFTKVDSSLIVQKYNNGCNIYSTELLTKVNGILIERANVKYSIEKTSIIYIDGPYIRVDKSTIWVTPEIIEKLMLMSNTHWQII